MFWQKFVTICIICNCLLILSNLALGYELLEPGVRANSLAGAFVGVSDDWSAIYWNPAGLLQPLDKELAVEGEYLSLSIKDGNSISNEKGIFGKHRLPVELPRFVQTNSSQTRYLPSVGFVFPLKGLAFGFGIYPRLSDYLDWKDHETQNLEASLMRRLQIYSGGIGFSTHIAPVVYVGAGLNVLYGEYELLAKKEYTGAYTFEYHLRQSTGTGLEVILGALYEPQQPLSAGVVYRSGGTINLRGGAKASCAPRYPDDEDSGYTKRVYLPPTYGFGLVSRHIPKATIAVDWSRIGWDVWREECTFERERILLKNPFEAEKNPNWRSADRWRLGLEVRPNPKWRIMLGGFYNQSPIRGAGIDMSSAMVEVDRLGVTGGVGYKRGNWEFNLGCQLSGGQDKIDDVEYQKNISKAQLLIKTHFY